MRIACCFDRMLRPETTGVYCRRALETMAEVVELAPSELAARPGGFDLYLFIDDGLDYPLPAELRPNAYWAIDTHLAFSRSLERARSVDFVFAAQRDGARRLVQNGVDATWLPLACDPALHDAGPMAKRWDLAFVGNIVGTRRLEYLSLIRARYPNSFIGNAYFEQMARIHAEARIVFNVGVADDVNMRVFEALASGSLLITDRASGLDELFQDGTHLVTYGSPAELMERVHQFLADEEAREGIAAAGRAEVLARHTYAERMRHVMETVKARKGRAAWAPGTSRRTAGKDRGYFEFARPELLALIPPEARKVLDIGCGSGALGASIKQRQPARVVGIELDPRAAEHARRRLDEVIQADIERDEDALAALPRRAFDVIVCGDVLEHLRDPAEQLRRARKWLAPAGVLVASLPNARHHSVLASLVAGNWTYEPAGLLDADHIQFFTRREIEKLLVRAGFRAVAMERIILPADAAILDPPSGAGGSGRFEVPGLVLEKLAPEDVADLATYQFIITATAAKGRRDSASPTSSARAPRARRPVLGRSAARERQEESRAADEALATLRIVADASTTEREPNDCLVTVAEFERRLETEGHEVFERPFDWCECPVLDHLREPKAALECLRNACVDGGGLQLELPTVAGAEAIEPLIRGSWHGADQPALRYFTRREIDKLLYRTGWEIERIEPLAGPGYAEWRAAGSPARIELPGGSSAQVSPQRAMEYHSRGFRLLCRPAPRPRRSLTSIVIVTHNQLHHTRACLESIRARTDEPIEIVVVDNASTDGTPGFLNARGDVRLVSNDENRGFPIAANQGIRAARGEQVLLLNNDTIVTTGWLARMLDALAADPRAGLVGPVSNNVSGEQQVRTDYRRLEELDGFAWDWSRRHEGKRVLTDRLVGFCLLIARSVIERIGLLDERFGIGSFEDDDYTLRAIRAGFRAVIARDSFVHHFGSATFRASGLDVGALIRANQRRFEDKWRSPSPPSATPAPPPPPASQRAVRPHRPPWKSVRKGARRGGRGGRTLERDEVALSLCMIARDNMATIGAALESIRPWVDEMVVIDTGSVDETIGICRRLGARVGHFPWRDDFAAARNASLAMARGRWIFWMDSDDIIPPECGRRLRELAVGETDPGILGYVIGVHCPAGGPDGHQDITAVDHVKLIRNRRDLVFEGRIHEQILPAIRRAGGAVAWTDLFVVHAGADHSPGGRQRKFERDYRILYRELAEDPKHPFVLFNLGMTHADEGNYAKAIHYLERSIVESPADLSLRRKTYALLASAYAALGQADQAWRVCQDGRRQFPEDAELLFRAAMLHHDAGRLEPAARGYRAVLAAREARHFQSLDLGLVGFKARHNLARVLEDMGDLAGARREWETVTRLRPVYRAGWRGLGELLLKAADEAGLEDLLRRLQDDPDLDRPALRAEAWLLDARRAEARGEHARSAALLAEARRRYPDDGEVLRAWARDRCENASPAAAEPALRALVARVPEDAAAHHNLGSALCAQGRFAEAVHSYRTSLALRPRSRATLEQLELALAARDGEVVAATLV